MVVVVFHGYLFCFSILDTTRFNITEMLSNPHF